MLAAITLLSLPFSYTAGANQGASFEQTRDWILSKIKKYDSPSRRKGTVDNYDGRAYFEITECKINSKETSMRDDGDKNVSYNKGYELTAIKRFEIDNVFLSFALRFSNQAGQYKYADNDFKHKGSLLFHFNYSDQEEDLEGRIQKAFFHLRDLALANPNCNDKELF